MEIPLEFLGVVKPVELTIILRMIRLQYKPVSFYGAQLNMMLNRYLLKIREVHEGMKVHWFLAVEVFHVAVQSKPTDSASERFHPFTSR